ncbi:MAG: hypothetical protein ACKOUR_08500 [Planctomycetota bacterium]
MIRRAMLVGSGMVVVLMLLFGRDALGYVWTSYRWARQSVQESVPLEVEIARARNMIQELAPEVRANLQVIAREEVEVRRLKEQLGEGEKVLGRDRQEISRLKGDLDRGGSLFVYAGQQYTAKQVEADLGRRFERFKTREATVDKLRRVLAARESGLAAATEKIKAMQGAQRQLEVDLENLKARLEMVKVAESTSAFQVDQGRLSRTREAVAEIRTRIDVAEKFVQSQVTPADQIPLDGVTEGSISEEVGRYLAEHPATDELVRLD